MRFLYRPNAGEPFKEVVFKGIGATNSTPIRSTMFNSSPGNMSSSITISGLAANITVIDVDNGYELKENINYTRKGDVVTVPSAAYPIQYMINEYA